MSDFALSHPAFNSYHIDATYDEMLADDGARGRNMRGSTGN